MDFKQFSKETPNYPGAEIEGVVKGGLSFALQRQVREKSEELCLSMADMLRIRGVRDMKPHYGAHHQWASYQRLGFLHFRPEVSSKNSLFCVLKQLIFTSVIMLTANPVDIVRKHAEVSPPTIKAQSAPASTFRFPPRPPAVRPRNSSMSPPELFLGDTAGAFPPLNNPRRRTNKVHHSVTISSSCPERNTMMTFLPSSVHEPVTSMAQLSPSSLAKKDSFPLGTSPTIFSLLQTGQWASRMSEEFRPTHGKTNPLDAEDKFSLRPSISTGDDLASSLQGDDGDDLMFALSLSVGQDTGFLVDSDVSFS